MLPVQRVDIANHGSGSADRVTGITYSLESTN